MFIWWYPGNCNGSLTTQTEGGGTDGPGPQLLRIFESFHTEWDTRMAREDVGKWLFAKLERLVDGRRADWSAVEYEVISHLEADSFTDKQLKLANPQTIPRTEFHPGLITAFLSNPTDIVVQIRWGPYQGTVLPPGRGTKFDAISGDKVYVTDSSGNPLMSPRILEVQNGIVQQIVITIDADVSGPSLDDAAKYR